MESGVYLGGRTSVGITSHFLYSTAGANIEGISILHTAPVFALSITAKQARLVAASDSRLMGAGVLPFAAAKKADISSA
jgi:hypothetical protein